jgi:hypothetical protein
LGQYASKPVDGSEVPATLDYYTDEGLLIALLAMGSPNPAYRLDRGVWDAIARKTGGGTFVRTYPGSLFTYQFFSVWVDTAGLGVDNHATRPMDLFDNSRDAILATRNYAIKNPKKRATWTSGKGAVR